jgi:hypothetical protein
VVAHSIERFPVRAVPEMEIADGEQGGDEGIAGGGLTPLAERRV